MNGPVLERGDARDEVVVNGCTAPSEGGMEGGGGGLCLCVCVSVIQAVRRTQHPSLMSPCLMWF